jgi:hypothetical protein
MALLRLNPGISLASDEGVAEDRSVDFSVDPKMFEKLAITKAKIVDLTEFEQQKVYEFQLDKDIRKIVDKRGR